MKLLWPCTQHTKMCNTTQEKENVKIKTFKPTHGKKSSQNYTTFNTRIFIPLKKHDI